MDEIVFKGFCLFNMTVYSDILGVTGPIHPTLFLATKRREFLRKKQKKMGGDSLSVRAAMMRKSLQKSQSITDDVVSVLGSFDHRLSALETAMRPTQVSARSPSVWLSYDDLELLLTCAAADLYQIRTHSIRKAHENIDRTLKAAEVILAQFDLCRQVRS